MQQDDLPSIVKRLLGDTCGFDPARVRDGARLAEYGLDSVRAVDLIVALEEAFEIQIEDGEAQRVKTVQDLVSCVEKKVAERGAA